jgi:membrane protease subunit HflK
MGRILLGLLALVILIWTAATSLTQVKPGERAVIRRFGRILDHKPEQGLYIGWPWGIERVDLVEVNKVRTITVGFTAKEDNDDEVIPAGQMLTGDHNLVNVQASINFRIKDAEKYVLQKDNLDAFLARAAESLLAEWIAAREVKDIIRFGKTELPPFLHARLADRLKAYDLGVEIDLPSIPKLGPPDQVKDAFDQVAQAQTGMKTKENQARQETNRREDETKAEVKRLALHAESYARVEKIKATTDADSFKLRLAQYRELLKKDPEYLNALWLDEMTQLYARMRANGQIELLDHFLTSEGLTITEFPLPRKK